MVKPGFKTSFLSSRHALLSLLCGVFLRHTLAEGTCLDFWLNSPCVGSRVGRVRTYSQWQPASYQNTEAPLEKYGKEEKKSRKERCRESEFREDRMYSQSGSPEKSEFDSRVE